MVRALRRMTTRLVSTDMDQKKRDFLYRWRANNPEKVREYAREYRLKNIEKIRAQVRERRSIRIDIQRELDRASGARNRKARILRAASYRAKNKWMPFTITADSIVWPLICPVYGIALDYDTQGRKECSPSLDRINNGLGYVVGNVQVISWRANRHKNNATPEELVMLAKFVTDQTRVR